MSRLALFYSAGTLGGLASSLALFLFAFYGFNEVIDVNIRPSLAPDWLYPQMVWGGLWAFAFLPNVLPNQPIKKALFIGLLPTMVQILLVYPLKYKLGVGGLELGHMTPLVLLGANLVWALVTALAARTLKK